MLAMTSGGIRAMLIGVAAAGMGLLSACTPAASSGDFDSADPASKLYAIVRAGETKDASAIPHLIEQLNSDDQAVRMYAIGALRRITGEDMGYVYYAPPAEREAAIQRWLEAYGARKLPIAADERR